jgi:hypothetical protein
MGKKIILLSKYKYDIKETLSKFAISNLLFDDILLLDQNQKKSGFIKNTNAIFIDDSFAERKEVFNTLKIPVFGVDAVESLLIWKV